MPKGGNGNGNGGNGGGGGSQDPKIVDQAFTTLENPIDGTSLGFVVADVKPSKATCAIVSGNDDGAYSIDPLTGELFIADGSAVDYEAEQTRDLIVQVTENGKKDYTATVTVNLTDVNEAPVVEAATVALITKAFDALKRDPKIGRSGALRQAMLSLINEGQHTWYPSSWAPFVVVGEGGN